jgi:hypothetical protein
MRLTIELKESPLGADREALTMIEALQRLIERLEADSSLQEPDNLRQRIEVLGRLDAFDLAMP